jgi:regulator of sigma E protease
LFGIYTPTFSIGFGPKLFRKKIGDTEFCLSAIPFGGYVEIAGLEEVGQGDQAHAQETGNRAFSSKSFIQKTLVLLGGILFNLSFAYAVFCVLFMIGDNRKLEPVRVYSVAAKSAAELAGLKKDDAIIAVTMNSDEATAEKPFIMLTDLLNTLQQSPNKELSLHIVRDNEPLTLVARLDAQTVDGKTIGLLGAGLNQHKPIEKLPFTKAIKRGITETNSWICAIATSMKTIFSRKSLDGASGPIRIIADGFDMAKNGFIPLFIFLALMSINLALFNLLPLGITDGGQLLFVFIEAIIRRPAPTIVRNGLNIISFGLFIFLAVYLTYTDISHLFGEHLAAAYSSVSRLFGN